MTPRSPNDADYRRLLALRTDLRRFEHWSAERAEAAGITTAQHQLVLAIRGHVGSHAPSVGDVAEALLLRQHSATELVNRAARVGLVRRVPDADDARVVRLVLTPLGRRRLAALSILHIEELTKLGRRLGPVFDELGFLWSETSR